MDNDGYLTRDDHPRQTPQGPVVMLSIEGLDIEVLDAALLVHIVQG